MRCLAVFASLALVACAGRQAAPRHPVVDSTAPTSTTTTPPPATTEVASTTTVTPPAETPARPTRQDFAVSRVPSDLVLAGDTLVWSSHAGEIWTMPAGGDAKPQRLSNQHKDGLLLHPFVAGQQVFAIAGRDVAAITVPDGPVTPRHLAALRDSIQEITGDDDSLYLTVFKRDEVVKVPAVGGGSAHHLMNAKQAVLALHGGTLYVASYETGALTALAGSAPPRTIATGLAGPTALVADDKAVYVYTERDQHVTRIDLATGTRKVLAEDLNNSDELDLDGDALYTVSWPGKLVRIPLEGGGAQVLADDLHEPRGVASDAHWVYVGTDSPPRIVRVPKPE